MSWARCCPQFGVAVGRPRLEVKSATTGSVRLTGSRLAVSWKSEEVGEEQLSMIRRGSISSALTSQLQNCREFLVVLGQPGLTVVL